MQYNYNTYYWNTLKEIENTNILKLKITIKYWLH